MSRARDRLEVMVLEAQGLLAVEGANDLDSYQDNVVLQTVVNDFIWCRCLGLMCD